MVPLLLFFATFAAAQDDAFDGVVGCGGFVAPSQDIVNSAVTVSNLESVSVRISTPEGTVKHETTCAPNGYFFIPLYERGNFVISVVGPDGWSFGTMLQLQCSQKKKDPSQKSRSPTQPTPAATTSTSSSQASASPDAFIALPVRPNPTGHNVRRRSWPCGCCRRRPQGR